MKVHLLFKDRDLDLQQKLPWNEQALIQDLELNPLFKAMAGDDEFLYRIAKLTLLTGPGNDLNTVLYRQAVLKDCLQNKSIVCRIYDLAIEAIRTKRRQWLGILGKYPGSILSGAIQLLQMFLEILGRLRQLGREHAQFFQSEGFTAFFQMIERELPDDYFEEIKGYLAELKFRNGILIGADLGKENEGTCYKLRRSQKPRSNWFQRLFEEGPPRFIFRIADRDEAGFRRLSELRDEGINEVANALAQSADHIMGFFGMLRAELAFYVGCTNLHLQLSRRAKQICFPVPRQAGACHHSCAGLRDASLVLTTSEEVVGNDMNATGKHLILITGANQGGKSTFLRSLGLAQVMMQCGMFVTAEAFEANLCESLFTHYKREEDVTMESGKFDEELSRMNEISNKLTQHAMILFNESFAATNEREGSEIARQIVRALMEAGFKIVYVTHLYEFAHGFVQNGADDVLFLRAERETDGRRTFKLRPGEPLQTSFGADLYERIFHQSPKNSIPQSTPIVTTPTK